MPTDQLHRRLSAEKSTHVSEGASALLELLSASTLLVSVFDPTNRLRYSNQAFRDAFFIEDGDSPTWEEFMRRNYHANRGTVITADDFDAWYRSAMSRRSKVESRTVETDLHDGRWLSMHETLLEDGWLLCLASDITYLRTEERALRIGYDGAVKAAFTDELTGVSNRRHVMSLLKRLCTSPDCDGRIMGHAVIFDLDHFKKVNDTFGHNAGDEVLVGFARVAQRSLRPSDGFGRIGGEEFLAIIKSAHASEALSIANRVVRNLRISALTEAAPNLRVTTSAGMAPIIGGHPTRAIFSNADAALYAAKSNGRNQICTYGEGSGD